MRTRVLAEALGQRTLLVVLESGEDVLAALQSFAKQERVTGASFTAIGAFQSATLGWFDFSKAEYRRIGVSQQCEAISVLGNVAIDERGDPSIHMHAVLGLSDGSTRGGHLLGARVRPTLEITMTEVPAHLRRRYQPAVGAALIDLTPPDAAYVGIGREPDGIQTHIADADKRARTGSEREQVRNTPPAGNWNDIA